MSDFFLRLYVVTTNLPSRPRDEEGAAMVEYALLVVGIAVVVGAAALALGGRIKDKFDSIKL